MAFKTSQTTFSEQGKLLLAELGRNKAKAMYDRKTLGKNGKT